MAPGGEEYRLGDDGYVEGEVGEGHHTIGDVEDEAIERLVGPRLDVVQPVLIDDALVEDVDLRPMSDHHGGIVVVVDSVVIDLEVAVQRRLVDDVDDILDVDAQLGHPQRRAIDGDAGALLDGDTAQIDHLQRIPVALRKDADVQLTLQDDFADASAEFQVVPGRYRPVEAFSRPVGHSAAHQVRHAESHCGRIRL